MVVMRNGRGALSDTGEVLNTWVVKVGDNEGNPLPNIGTIMQPFSSIDNGEGSLTIFEWLETDDGLRYPEFAFSDEVPPQFSARIAPQIVGIGLLEAIDENDILLWEDPDDLDEDGISGRASRIVDPETSDIRLGRLGWKASTVSVRHQTASALNGDMGVMTSVLPEPDCGAEQENCGNDAGPELSEQHLDTLVRYVSLLGYAHVEISMMPRHFKARNYSPTLGVLIVTGQHLRPACIIHWLNSVHKPYIHTPICCYTMWEKDWLIHR